MKNSCRIAIQTGLLTALSLALPAWAQDTLPALDNKPKPGVVALVAAVGDQVDFVRQKQSTGSHLEPFIRKRMPVNGQALNFAVLRGLDAAIADDEPASTRVLLQWSMPPQTRQRLEDAPGNQREAIVLEALQEHLRALPERAQWDRIEAIVPSYFFSELRGMGRKLSGIGIYVQPLKSSSIDFSENGDMMETARDGDHRTINPNTGATGRSSTYVAPYMYFQRVTLDARTLSVLAKKRQFDNVKFADPESTANDVFKQMPLAQMMEKLLETVERSAYKSVRDPKTEVQVTVPVVLPAASAPR